jgi:hypothetical protein
LTEFLNAILAFPTVLFTIPLGVVVVYWLFVLLGALDINLLGDADLDGHGHTDLHVDGHGHVDGHHFDGHGHHAHDGHGHGHGDGHDGHDGHEGGVAGLIQALGLGGVPVTLMLSLLILTAWVFCIGGGQLLGPESPDWQEWAAALVSLGLAVPVTGFLIRPLRRFFRTITAPQHRDLLGKICTITTLRVDERYGQAEVEDGGAGLIVQVRSTDPGRLSRGDRAVIFDYRDEVFHVAPMDETLRRNLDQLGSRERG